jgi:hypothetical protein
MTLYLSIGGHIAGTVLNDLYQFDSDSFAWINITENKLSAQLPTPRWGVSASSAANKLYIFGGFSTIGGDVCFIDSINSNWSTCAKDN